jgi:predicted lipoprotein
MLDRQSRIEALEADLKETKDELRKILLDIRAYLMEIQTPIPKDMDKEDMRQELETERG